jgi:hypothetical protein
VARREEDQAVRDPREVDGSERQHSCSPAYERVVVDAFAARGITLTITF